MDVLDCTKYQQLLYMNFSDFRFDQGRVAVGVGRFLRIYDLGKKKLLRKCENKVRIFSKWYTVLILLQL